MPSIVSFVKTLENFFFRFRVQTLAVLLVFTLGMGWLATQLHMTAGFDKQCMDVSAAEDLVAGSG